MLIQIRTHGVERSAELEAHIDRQLQFALGRFADQIRTIAVHLADLNGPRGGIDQECRLHVVPSKRDGLDARGGLVIEELDRDIYAAIARASDRAGRAVSRHLSLRRHVSHLVHSHTN
jgi:putative sigma-54 modulation protein